MIIWNKYNYFQIFMRRTIEKPKHIKHNQENITLPLRTHDQHQETGKSQTTESVKMFFDIKYIFNDPLDNKKHKRYLRGYRSGSNQGDRRQTHSKNQSKGGEIYEQKMITEGKILKIEPVLTKRSLNVQKTNLCFEKETAKQKIHSRKSTISYLTPRSNSMRQSHKFTENSNTITEEILLGKGFHDHTQTRKNPQRQKRRQRQRIQNIIKKIENMDNNIQLNYELNKHLKFRQNDSGSPACSSKSIQWARNSLIMRNKQSIRIYRPWSPIHMDHSQAFVYQNNQL